MGNEFGHPEWIDFPREGNGWSFHYCRRQWSLRENGLLKYEWLGQFDEDMIHLTRAHRIFNQRMGDMRIIRHDDKAIAFYRNGLLFAFNFHPSQSLTDVVIPVPHRANYTVAMCSDDEVYGGQGLVKHMSYRVRNIDGQPCIMVYLPARTAIVLQEGPELQKPGRKPGKAAEAKAEAPKKPGRSKKAASAAPKA